MVPVTFTAILAPISRVGPRDDVRTLLTKAPVFLRTLPQTKDYIFIGRKGNGPSERFRDFPKVTY